MKILVLTVIGCFISFCAQADALKPYEKMEIISFTNAIPVLTTNIATVVISGVVIESSTNKIHVLARVDGKKVCNWHYSSTLKITSPSELRGRTLETWHQLNSESPLCKVGEEIKFKTLSMAVMPEEDPMRITFNEYSLIGNIEKRQNQSSEVFRQR